MSIYEHFCLAFFFLIEFVLVTLLMGSFIRSARDFAIKNFLFKNLVKSI